MSEQRVVVIGDALIDELRDTRGVREFVGGAALNVAVGLARLGTPTTLIAMVGTDEDGRRIRTFLDTFGVELLDSPAPFGTARAVSERGASGEPTYAFNDAARRRRICYGEAERAAIAAAPVTVVSCVAFDDAAQTEDLIEAVAGTPTMLVVDPNPRAGMMRDRAAFIAGFEEIVAGCALIKVGEDDARLLYGSDIGELRDRCVALGAAVVVATAGSAGATLTDGAAIVSKPIAAVPGAVVDTMGAGDAVLATIANGMVRSMPQTLGDWAELLERAQLIAAWTCRSSGAMLRLPPTDDRAPHTRIGT